MTINVASMELPTGARHGAVRRWYASASVTEITLVVPTTIALARNAIR